MFGSAELSQSKANEAVRQAGYGTNTEFQKIHNQMESKEFLMTTEV